MEEDSRIRLRVVPPVATRNAVRLVTIEVARGSE